MHGPVAGRLPGGCRSPGRLQSKGETMPTEGFTKDVRLRPSTHRAMKLCATELGMSLAELMDTVSLRWLADRKRMADRAARRKAARAAKGGD